MISIVTGTYNRKDLLEGLIKNTVDASERLELVLVDGGSTDETVEYIKDFNHPRIKLIEVGERSSYPHFMNLGIRNASHELVVQWNDDVLLRNDWEDVFAEIDDHDFYIFSWAIGDSKTRWNLLDTETELVMNYGIYNKKVFREIGMYNPIYSFYYADGDMSYRARAFGYKHKSLRNVKVISIPGTPKNVAQRPSDVNIYTNARKLYDKKKLPDGIEYL